MATPTGLVPTGIGMPTNAALFWLKNFLNERKVTPIVLRDQPRTGAEILALLDEKIDKCAAGFVLLTRTTREDCLHGPVQPRTS